MDEYSKLDHATLLRNLNVVCRELGLLLDSAGLYCGPPALTLEDVREKIPDALHAIAINAGWIEKSVEVDDEESEPELIDVLGGSLVKEPYKEWFLRSVEGTLADLSEKASANKPAQDRDYERLMTEAAKGKKPVFVKKRDWPSRYEDGTETPKGILDRRRNAMHWEWEILHKAVEKEWIKREKQRRNEHNLEAGKRLSFGMDSLLSIRRADSHPLPQRKVEVVAAIISLPGTGKPIPQPIPWTALRWRNDSLSS